MKKIEKLNMYVPDIKKSHYVAILNIANKVDELIDYLNQSQKEQPEEDYKCGTLEVLKNPKLRERLEKQEKWKEELWKIMFNDRTQLAEANLNKPYTGEYQGKAEELISQLLSERTRDTINEFLRITNEYNEVMKKPRIMSTPNGDNKYKVTVETSKLLKDDDEIQINK